MELVANLWPIVDSTSELILRFAARAYAMDATETVISSTLKNLASSDFVLAQQFQIPKRFTFASGQGEIAGAVTASDFNILQATVIEAALQTLESEMPLLHGVGVDSEGKPFQNRIAVRFPKNPYFVVTFLIEDATGQLRIYSAA